MKKPLYFMAITLFLASCSNTETTETNEQTETTESSADSTETSVSQSENLEAPTEVASKSFTNESIVGSWTYQKSVTTVEGEVMEISIPGEWWLEFDGANCRDIKEGDEAQINPYVVEGDSLIFSEMRFLSMKIVDVTDTLLTLGQDEYTVLHFSKIAK